jgi:hypothetical protein
MVTLMQRCPAPGCDGDVRYRVTGGEVRPEGSCDGCQRVYRLNPGRAPTEIDRADLELLA